jgi:FKBP-type peptidyl-prolyl cis-trans isomerase
MIFRRYGFLFVLGAVLVLIAWQARTGIFRRANPGEPANKYMRQVMDNPQLSTADAEILRTQYGNAHANPSGLHYILRQPGEGPTPAPGAQVVVHYEGFLLDGTKFDSSRDLGKPLTFAVGMGRVIKGWDEALLTMKKGEKRTLLIPWWLAFGEAGKGPVPKRATVRFEIELVNFQ